MCMFLFNVRYVRNQGSINVNDSLSIGIPGCEVASKQKAQGKRKRRNSTGRPWYQSGPDSACQCRGHAAKQLSPGATAPEFRFHSHPSPCAWSPSSTARGDTAARSPHRAAEEPPLAAACGLTRSSRDSGQPHINSLITFFQAEGRASRAQATFVHTNSIYVHPPLTAWRVGEGMGGKLLLKLKIYMYTL